MPTRITAVARIIALFLLILGFAACNEMAGDGPGIVVEKYFQAIVEGNEDQISTLACADWESSARADVAAFYGVQARLEDVICQPIETGDAAQPDSAVVECSGAIIATYNHEDSSFELAGKQFKVINQGGEWLVCGYVE